MQIRDRIRELRRVPASQLLPHPKNWRTHPEQQQNALRGVLAEVGYADALLVRETTSGDLQLIDGHLRAETTPDAIVPVLVLDVSEEEAEKILLTHDPLSNLAGVNTHQLSQLVEKCDFSSPNVQEMLSRLQVENTKDGWPYTDIDEVPEVELQESFQIVIECRDEEQQQEVFERMRKEGFRCRVLTL